MSELRHELMASFFAAEQKSFPIVVTPDSN